MADTPAFRHVIPIAGESTDQYRLRVLENAVYSLAVRFDKHMEQVQKNDLVQMEAITRCKRHDDDVIILREKANEHESDIQTLKAAVAREPTQAIMAVPARSVWDVLYHPATPMAFCIVAMIYFFTLYVAANSGRAVDSLIPHRDPQPAATK